MPDAQNIFIIEKEARPLRIRDGLLTLPDDGELSRLLGAEIADRTPVHAWPLSKVERLSTEKGVFALKTQLAAASVERAFYAAAKHPVLLSPAAAGDCGDCGFLLLPWADGEPEVWDSLTDGEVRRRVRELSGVFQTFGDVPVWRSYTSEDDIRDTLADLRAVWPAEKSGALSTLEVWAERVGLPCLRRDTGLVHGDLKAENLVGGFVLDWQRPMRAPLFLEEETALLLSGRDGAGAEASFAAFVLAGWFARAYRRFLPWPFVRGEAVRYARLAAVKAGIGMQYGKESTE